MTGRSRDTWFYVLVTAVVLTVVVFIGCSIYQTINAPHRGTVHAKQYSAPYTSTICHTSNKVTICTPQYYPASWRFDLYQTSTRHGWRQVDQVTFHRYAVGDYYSDGDK